MSLLLSAIKQSKENESKSSCSSIISSARGKVENLFSAKKLSSEKRKLPGIIPITLISGGICALGGGFYFYHQIKPVNQLIALSAAATLHVTPNANSQPVVATSTVLISLPEIASAVALIEEPAIPTPPAQAIKLKPAPLNIRHQPEPDSIDPILASAYQAYQNGDYVNAEQRYNDALRRDSKNRDALLGLAAIAQQQGQDEAALQFYHRVLVLDPLDPIAHAALASLVRTDTGSKESRLRLLIVKQPDSAALRFALGNTYADQSRWPEAQHAYFNALAIEPGNALYAFNLAVSLDHLGQRNLAAQYYRQALQLDTSGHSGFTREQAQQRLIQITGQ